MDEITVYWDHEVNDDRELHITFYPTNKNSNLTEKRYSKDDLSMYFVELLEYFEEGEAFFESEEEDQDKWDSDVWNTLIKLDNFGEKLCEFINSGNVDFEPILCDIWDSLEEHYRKMEPN